MRGVRDLWSEMVERRLWPVALLLVVALVAVPVVLAKKPAAQDTAATTTAAPPAAAAARAADLRTAGEPVVSVAAGGGASAPLRGHAKNPFKQQHVPARAAIEGGTPATGTTPAPIDTGGNGTDTGSGGGGSGGGAGGGDEGQTPQTYVYAAIDVRFGRAGLPLREIRDVPRLTPLPSATQPIVIFMGMRADRETAVFMVSTDVHAQGEGRCVPSRKLCEAIELRRDEIALLDWAEPDGSVTQYELDLTDVTLHETTSKSKAQATVAEARASWMQRDGAGASVRRQDAPQAAAGTAPRGPSLVPLP